MQNHETPEERDARIAAALARSGTPSAVTAPVTPDELARHREQAARRLGGGAEKNPTERHLAYWGTVAENAEAQIRLFSSDAPEAAWEDYAVTLTDALIRLGRFDEALDWAPSVDLINRATAMREACALDDSDECACPDYVILVEHPKDPNVAARKKQAPRHQAADRVYRADLDAVVHVVTCLRCGHENARPDLPALLQHRFDLVAEYPQKGAGSDWEHLLDAPADAELG